MVCVYLHIHIYPYYLETPAITVDMHGPLHMIIIFCVLESFKKQRISLSSDGFTLTKHSLTSKYNGRDVFNVWFFFYLFFSPQLIFVHSWYTHVHSVLFAVNEKRGFVELLYSVWAYGFRRSHSGAGLMGGRFRCLKYWVTCWGSSARTDLVRVSFGAWRRKRETGQVNLKQTTKNTEEVNSFWLSGTRLHNKRLS